MAKKIEINNLNSNGDYEIMYPKTIPEMVENLLLKDTKALIGFEEIATPNDMFRKLILRCKSVCYLTFVDSTNQTPIENLEVFCDLFCDASGTAMTSYTTDADGKITAFVSNINPTIKISGYADVVDFSQTLEVDALGKEFEWVIPLTTRNFIKYTSTTSVRFTSNVTKVNVTAVGGGGAGGSGYFSNGTYNNYYSPGGGGAGGDCIIKEDLQFSPNIFYPLIVGSGGAGSGNNGYGGPSGGKSSFLGLEASGGIGGKGGRYASSGDYANIAIGNGNGGSWYIANQADNPRYGYAGTQGTMIGYSSFTETIIYGGGGGGGKSGESGTRPQGGGYGGGGGAKNYAGTDLPAQNGVDGYGGGGGGGYSWHYSGSKYGGETGASGGSGCIAIRMFLKSHQ